VGASLMTASLGHSVLASGWHERDCSVMTIPDAPWESLGLLIGHATDEAGATGCTVILGADGPFRCGVALLGRASATRELGTCDPSHLVDRTDAVLLTGGSAYGLDAAAGVMRWMEERQRGFPVAQGVVPIVPAASLFDLAPLGRFEARPTPDMAHAACAHASSRDVAEGSVGAGTGALVGKGAGVARAMKGGVGVGVAAGAGQLVAAIAAVNAFGDVRDANSCIIAGARADGGGFVDIDARTQEGVMLSQLPTTREHTTIACVAISACLTKLQLAQVADSATTALRKRISPSATAFDGDVVFVIGPCTGEPAPLPVVEALAIAALERAIEQGVRSARGRDGFPGLADSTPAAGTL